jgi:hypothetical protein
MPPRKCWFCFREGGTVKITKEHIYGDWTKNVLPPQARIRAITEGAWRPGQGYMIVKDMQIPEPHHQTKVNGFCKPCNEGWMEDLEAPLQQMAPRLFYARPTSFSAGEAEAIACWAAMKAMVRDAASNPAIRAVRAADRKRMYLSHKPVPNTYVWLATTPKREAQVGDWHHTMGLFPTSYAPAGIERANTYVTTTIFHRLVVIVACSRAVAGAIEDVSVALPDALVRVWPNAQPFDWPLKRPLTFEALQELGHGHGIFLLE